MRYFNPGELIDMEIGGQAKIVKKLGEGGQGAVYLVEFMGQEYALKWYKAGAIRNERDFKANLSDNIRDDAPSAKFMWPKFMSNDKEGAFGYLMDVFPSEYTSFTKLLLDPRNNRFSGLEATINAALNIINAFRDLHRVGKSYQDLNDGGFVVRLSDGDVLICDCDNVSPNGINLGIAGKPGYMAPEIVTGGGKIKPSMRTDAYSLANVLFRLLMRGDPLAGAADSAKVCLTEAAEMELYGTNPVFVYDPNNDSNRPVRGVHNNVIQAWPTYPQFIRDAFIEAFTVGTKDPNTRITENEWQKLFVRLKGELIGCLGCGIRGFAGIFKHDGDKLVCPACGHAHPMPRVLTLNTFPVLLFPGVKLLKGHTDSKTNSLSSEDYLTQTGLIIQNPKDPSRWGIRNMSGSAWGVKEPGADGRRELENGKTVAVQPGLEITFANGVTASIS